MRLVVGLIVDAFIGFACEFNRLLLDRGSAFVLLSGFDCVEVEVENVEASG